MRSVASAQSISSRSPGMEGCGSGAERCDLVAQWQYYLYSFCNITVKAALARSTLASSQSILHNPQTTAPINGSAFSSSKAIFQQHVNHSNTNFCFFLCRSNFNFHLTVFDSSCGFQSWRIVDGSVPAALCSGSVCCLCLSDVCFMHCGQRKQGREGLRLLSGQSSFFPQGTNSLAIMINIMKLLPLSVWW